jgi:hypothetical protein
MKSIEYISEETFESTIIDFTDEHYDLSDRIHKSFGNYGPLLATDKGTLIFGVNLESDRSRSELGESLYRITIEKI